MQKSLINLLAGMIFDTQGAVENTAPPNLIRSAIERYRPILLCSPATAHGFIVQRSCSRNVSHRYGIHYSVGANATHGQRRTNADKRQAVMTLLEDGRADGCL